MKIQPLSTLTYQRASILFFLTLLNLKESEAGQSFKNCFKYAANDTTTYDSLLKFSFETNPLINSNIQIELCCDGKKCLECTTTNSYLYCRKVFNQIFCHQHGAKYPSRCIGIIGNGKNSLITENKSNYGANCSISTQYRDKFDLVRILINSGPITGLDQGYGSYKCLSDYCLGGTSYCGWDNGGWMCYSHVDSGPEYCYMQWPAPWPGHAETNPFNTTTPTNPITTTTTTTSTTSTSTIEATLAPATATPAPAPSTDDHLVEKIAISVGTVAGASVTAFLTYCFCQKKKKQQQSLVNNDNSGQQSFDNLASQRQSGVTDFSDQTTVNNLINSPIMSDKHSTILEIPTSPTSQKSVSDIKEQLIKQLELELVGKEQLWNNYLDANNLIMNNPQSQLALKEYYQIQNELLQTFTINDLNLLLENEVNKQVRSPRNSHFETTENPLQNNLLNNYFQSYYEEAAAHNPQGVNSNYHY